LYTSGNTQQDGLQFMKSLLALIISGLVLVGCKLVEPPPPPPPPPASGIGFFSSCDSPPGALVIKGEGDESLYTFTLKDKDIGGCEADGQAGKTAPFLERAELSQQGNLDLSEPQELKFDARFRHGFIGKQESFFHIQNITPTCPVGPSMVMNWHRGQLEISTLQDSGILKPKRFPEFKVDEFRSWKSWKIRVAQKSKTVLVIDVILEGERIGRRHFAYRPECGAPYVNFGIRRPGNSRDSNETSIAQFRKFSLKPLNPPKKEMAKGPPLRKLVEEGVQDPPMMIKKPKTAKPMEPIVKLKEPVNIAVPSKLTIIRKSSKPVVPPELTITHKSSTPLE
jgi:hypothetical protein